MLVEEGLSNDVTFEQKVKGSGELANFLPGERQWALGEQRTEAEVCWLR